MDNLTGASDEEGGSSHDADSDRESWCEEFSDDNDTFVCTSSNQESIGDVRGLLLEELLGEDLECEATETGVLNFSLLSAHPILLCIQIIELPMKI